MLATLVVVLTTLVPSQATAPQLPTPGNVPPATVRGIVVDAKNATPLADARVLLVEPALTTQTAADGTFSFANIKPGKYTIAVTTIGYIYVRRQIEVLADRGLALTIPLSEGTGTYRETVSVTADTTRPAALGVSSQSELGSAALQDLRGVLADDPMRAVQALPGVATGDDFQAQFSVRGVAFRQVGIVIDGTQASMLMHSIRGVNDSGSVAMVNSDVLDHASLFSGPHPQRHGDWLGATLDFEMRDGSRDRNIARVAISGTNASLVLEGPIGRSHRGSWLTSVRKSYIDWLVAKIDPAISSTFGFTDIQGKLNYDLTSRQRLEMTVLAGHSAYKDSDPGLTNGVAKAGSKSGLASMGWQYTRNNLLVQQRISIATNTFGNDGIQGQALGDGDLQTKIWRGDVTWLQSRTWTFDAGARVAAEHDNRVLQHWVSLGGGRIRLGTSVPTEGSTRLSSLWGQGTYRTTHVGLSFGVRATSDSLSGQRVTSPWLLTELNAGRFTLRASAGASHQFPDLELLPLSTARVAERARSVDLGVEHRLTSTLRWQVTAFARNDEDVVRILGEPKIANGKLVAETPFPSFAGTLSGRTTGVDLLVGRRALTGLTGWVAYTYSHTRYRDRLTAESFDSDFDQRHTLNIFLLQRLGYRTSVNAKLRVGSNFPIVGYFAGTASALTLGTTRNAVRLPVYARLDLRLSRTFTFDRRRATLFFEIMNTLGRRNLGQFDGTIRSNFETTGYVDRMLPRVPSAGLLIEF